MKMSKLNVVSWIMLSTLMVPGLAFAKTWGIGAVIGAPTGLSANYFLSESRTIHTTIAYDFDGDDELQLASHYTWRRNDIGLEKVKIGWFYGAGAKFAYADHDSYYDHHHQEHHHDGDHFSIGPSGTIGLFHEFTEVPVEVFLKGNLTVNIIQDTDVDADAMLGVHYNF